MENNSRLYETVFKEYSGESWVVISKPRESIHNRRNVEIKSDRTGISENAEQGISDNEVADNIKYQSRTSDLDDKYLNAVNSGGIETA